MDRIGLVKLPGRAWVYRRRIPKDLRGAFGKSEWFRSLDTHEEVEALRLCPEVHSEYERRLRQAREGETLEPETNLFVVVGMFVHDLIGKLEDGEDPAELLKLWLIEQNDEANPLTDGIAFSGPRSQKILAAVTEIVRGMRIRSTRNREWTKPGLRPRYGECMGDLAKRWSEQPG